MKKETEKLISDIEYYNKENKYKILDQKPIKSLPEPEYKPEKIDTTELDKLDLLIDKANEQMRLFYRYETDLQSYKNWISDGKEAAKNALDCDNIVKAIE